MRLNFSFKDAVVRRTNKSSFDIVFDVSRLATKVLSTESRIYVETVNLTEFMDQFTKEDLNGFLEVRCNAIGAEDEWDSGEGNIGDTLIYRSPMENYQVFNNPSPMFLYNFKIQKWFFSKNITFKINFFDIHGDPYETFESSEKQVDKTNASYTNYSNKLGEITNKNREIDQVQTLFNTTRQNTTDFADESKDREDAFGQELDDLLDHITTQRDNATSPSVISAWNDAITAIGVSGTDLTRINWFDNVLDLSSYPYNRTDNHNRTLLRNAKQSYIDQLRAINRYSTYAQNLLDLRSSQTFIPRIYSPVLTTPANRFVSVLPPGASFNYTTEGNSKTGSIELEIINIDIFIGITIKSLTPSGTAPVENEVLVISGDQFTPIDVLAGASDLKITLTKIENKSLKTLEGEKLVLETDLETLKNNLTYTVNNVNVELGQNLNDVIKAMNMSFVIYDEIDPITQASTDAIKGNNYMRVLPCNVKRF